MNRYHSAECQACGKKFAESDDIVVCPDCGAPYHRDCVKNIGKCVFYEKHAEGFKFELPREKSDAEGNGQAGQKSVCPICGYLNPPESIYCSRCGGQISGRQSGQPFTGAGFNANPFSGYQNPGAGYKTESVDENEEIDGVRAGDIAEYVGENSGYFVSRFKDINNRPGRYTRFNLSALLFEQWYFVYRKMWGPAAVILILTLLLSLPSALYQLYLGGAISLNINTDMLTLLNSGCYLLSVALRALVSFYANRIYMKRVIGKIKKLKVSCKTEEEYREKLKSSGSVSKPAVIIWFGVYFVTVLFIMTLILMSRF